MEYIMLLLAWNSWINVGVGGLYEKFSYSARGYDSMPECERHLESLKRNLPIGVEITQASCVVAIK